MSRLLVLFVPFVVLVSGMVGVLPVRAEDWSPSLRKDLHHLAQCLVDVQPNKASRVIALASNDPEGVRLLGEMVRDHGGCLRRVGSLRVRHTLLVGAMADLVLRRRTDLLRAAMQLPSHSADRPPPVVQHDAFLIAYGRCLAESSPKQAVAVIHAAEMSADERQAIVGFGQSLSDCMPFGVQYTLQYGELRTTIAASLYQLAVAQAITGAAHA